MESAILPVLLSVALFFEGRWNLARKNWPGRFIIFLALAVIAVTAAAVLYYRMWLGLAISMLVLTGELFITFRYPPSSEISD